MTFKKATPEERKAYLKDYHALIRKIRTYTNADTELLGKAWRLAEKRHDGQRRKNNVPYITHPLAVAHFLADLRLENEIIAAALLHDVLEDTPTSLAELEDLVGSDVAGLVQAVTNLDGPLQGYETMQKEDVDVLSDVHLVEAITNNPQALYVKVGDRVHNLSDMEHMPYHKVIKKIEHTEVVLIPLLQLAGAYRLIEILEEMCLHLGNSECFRIIEQGYQKLLAQNSGAINDVQKILSDIYFADPRRTDEESSVYADPFGSSHRTAEQPRKWKGHILHCSFTRRYIASINHDLSPGVTNIFMELPASITKEKVPLYDIYFVTKEEDTENIFFDRYPDLYRAVIPSDERFLARRINLTIIGSGKDSLTGIPFYLLQDSCSVRYRLFLENEQQYKDRIHGSIYRRKDERMRRPPVTDRVEPTAGFDKQIHVYLADGTLEVLQAGSTVLDLAFRIHEDVGLCAKHAFLNGNDSPVPLHTRLNDGDKVRIITEADKDHPENNHFNATIRWVEYVHSRDAIRSISRYLEKHMEDAWTKIRVFGGDAVARETQTGATVLDYAFLVSPKMGLRFRAAKINQSGEVGPETILSYDDKVYILTDEKETACFNWLRIVRTRHAREVLASYFEKKYQE